MRTKKIFVILIAIFFVFVLVFSAIFIFSVNKVDVKYSVSDESDISEIEKKLAEYKGTNLLFLDIDDVMLSLKDYPYFELTKAEKSYPNVLEIEVVERMETYHIEHSGKVYVTTKDGILLNIIDFANYTESNSREVIHVTLNGIEFQKTVLGEKIETTGDQLILSMFSMAEAVNLTDCIKSISVTKATEVNDVVLKTYTGVEIVVENAIKRGIDKIEKAFYAYENITSDYQKLNEVITVLELDDGTIRVMWGEEDNYYE